MTYGTGKTDQKDSKKIKHLTERDLSNFHILDTLVEKAKVTKIFSEISFELPAFISRQMT
jgi:hypothetical protein